MSDARALFEKHHEALYRYLTRFCGDADVAADAAQEAFVRLIERPPKNGATKAWLFTVATNLVMESSRTANRRMRILEATSHDLPAVTSAEDPQAAVETADRIRVIREALSALSPKERTALLMREEGFSHSEIAEAVGTTTGSVGTLLARALNRVTLHLTPTLGTI